MEDVFAKVQEAFRGAFGTDPQAITMDTSPDNVSGWDSLGHLSLASRLEETFSINLDVDDLMGMENVRDIVRIIQSKLSVEKYDDMS